MDKKAWGAALLGLLTLLSGAGLRMIEALSAAHLAWAIAGLCILYLLGHWLVSAQRRVAFYWRWDWPWWGLVPLNEAAELAFKRLRGTPYEADAVRLPTPETRLDRMASILNYEARDIYGRKPPGELRQLSWSERRTLNIEGGGMRLHGDKNPRPSFEDLRIYRWDLWATLKRLRSERLVNTHAIS